MKKKLCAILFGLFLCFSSLAQTNVAPTNFVSAPFRYLHALRVIHQTPTNFFNARETVAEFAPTISSSSLLNSRAHYTIGYSLEVEHWTSQNLGIGIEIGSYDYRNGLDHFAILEDFRYIPFQQYKFWSRLAVGWKTGAETSLVDGTKALEFGGELYWHFSTNCRLEADIVQHQRTDSSKNGQTGRIAIQWLF